MYDTSTMIINVYENDIQRIDNLIGRYQAYMDCDISEEKADEYSEYLSLLKYRRKRTLTELFQRIVDIEDEANNG